MMDATTKDDPAWARDDEDLDVSKVQISLTQSSSGSHAHPTPATADKEIKTDMPMDSDPPAWLADPESGSIQSPNAASAPPPTALPPPGVKTGDSRVDSMLPAATVQPEKNLGVYILIMRVGNLAAMVLLGVASVFAMIMTVEIDNIILGELGLRGDMGGERGERVFFSRTL